MNSPAITLGADPKDYLRSTVSKRIFELAEKQQLLFAHYEYRWPIPIPGHWLPQQGGYQQGEAVWQNGVLSEQKYQSFRHDSAVCNFHPGQSSKWGAHELCHKLVGFAWKEEGDLLFHTLSAWAAEVLPVTVYYFWDEIDSYKCARHKEFGGSPSIYCHDCEERVEIQTHKKSKLLEEGWTFLEQQLQAIEASWKAKRLLPAPYQNLDLADDAYHYMLSQQPRMASDVYKDFMSNVVPNQVYVKSIEDLLLKIRKVAKAIVEDASMDSLNLEKKDWIVLDIGFRGLELAESMDEESKSIFTDLIYDFIQTKDLENFVANYSNLAEEIHLPKPQEFFGVGYELWGDLGFCKEQVLEGIYSIAPNMIKEIDTDGFLHADRNQRNYLGHRLKDFFSEEDLHVEIFLNQPQAFFKKHYSFGKPNSLYQWSSRVRICKNTPVLKRLLGVNESAFLLYKDETGQILTYPVATSLIKSQNTTFSLEDLPLSLEEKDFYVQNLIVVEI
jgi:hypothetical protein